MNAPGHTLTADAARQLARAARFAARFSRETVNRTNGPVALPPYTPATVAWPVKVTGEPPGGSEELSALWPGTVYVPNPAGAPVWLEATCWLRTIPGETLAAGGVGLARLVGWRAADGTYPALPIYALVCCGGGGGSGVAGPPTPEENSVPQFTADPSPGELRSTPLYVVPSTGTTVPTKLILYAVDNPTTSTPAFQLSVVRDNGSAVPQFTIDYFPSGTGSASFPLFVVTPDKDLKQFTLSGRTLSQYVASPSTGVFTVVTGAATGAQGVIQQLTVDSSNRVTAYQEDYKLWDGSSTITGSLVAGISGGGITLTGTNLTLTGVTVSGYQPLDATLTALAGVTTAANTLIYATGADAFATTDLTATARGLLDDTSTSAMRATLGVVIGTDVQAHDDDLDAISALSGTNTIYYRSGVSTWSAVTIGTGLAFSGGTLSAAGGGVGPAPGTPTSLAGAAGDTQIVWTWVAPSSGQAPSGYVLDTATDSGFATGLTTTVLGNVLTYTSTGLANGTLYYARVRGTYNGAAGPNSSSASATPALPPPALSAVGSNGTTGNMVVSMPANSTGVLHVTLNLDGTAPAAPAGWTRQKTQLTAGNESQGAVYTRSADGSSSVNFGNGSQSNWRAIAAVFTGVTSVDGTPTGGQTSLSTSSVAPTITSSGAGRTLVNSWFTGAVASVTITPPGTQSTSISAGVLAVSIGSETVGSGATGTRAASVGATARNSGAISTLLY